MLNYIIEDVCTQLRSQTSSDERKFPTCVSAADRFDFASNQITFAVIPTLLERSSSLNAKTLIEYSKKRDTVL